MHSTGAPVEPLAMGSHKSGPWKVQASWGAVNTSNPIREIIETMNLAENPDKKVIPLSIGDPTIFGNLKPCKEILDSLQRANGCGKYYGYQTAAGMESARKAVADYHFRCTGNKVKRQDVILASGCSHAIDLCICVLARSGQNILIPRPGFPLYKTLTSVYGVHYKQYNLLANENWSIDLKHLESLIDDNTAAIVINNPSNPCGSVFSRRHLIQILDLAERYRLPIIADEIYDKFVFSPELYNAAFNFSSDSLGDPQLSPQQQRPRSALAEQSVSSDNLIDKSEQHNREDPTRASTIKFMNNKLQQRQSDENTRQAPEAKKIDKQLLSFGNLNGNQRHSTARGVQNNENIELSPDPPATLQGKPLEVDYKASGLFSGSEPSTAADDDSPARYVPFIALSSISNTVPILTCGGISKTCLIPGLRLGWIIINDKQNIFDVSIRNGLARLTQRLMGPNSLVQGALSDILTTVPESFYTQTMDFIFKNAKLCFDKLRLVPGLRPYMPQGSMYLMVRFEAKNFPTIDGDLDFTSKLMNEESVLVLPGRCFDFPNYFRICLTVPTHVMEEALDRMAQFCDRHHVDNQIKTLISDSDMATPVKVGSDYLVTQQQQASVRLNSTASSNVNKQSQQTNKCK